MPTPTYDLIASNVLTSSASSVTFSSIPQTFRDLVIVVRYSGSTANGARYEFNGSTSTIFNYVAMQGDGSGSNSVSVNNGFGYLYKTSSIFTGNVALSIIQIMDYSTTDKHKTILERWNRAEAAVEASATRWANTSAITQVSFVMDSGNYQAGSTFYLYGIVS